MMASGIQVLKDEQAEILGSAPIYPSREFETLDQYWTQTTSSGETVPVRVLRFLCLTLSFVLYLFPRYRSFLFKHLSMTA